MALATVAVVLAVAAGAALVTRSVREGTRGPDLALSSDLRVCLFSNPLGEAPLPSIPYVRWAAVLGSHSAQGQGVRKARTDWEVA